MAARTSQWPVRILSRQGRWSPPNIEAQINILRQDGSGIFRLTQRSRLSFGNKVGVGDVNGDGLNDLVVFDDEAGRPVLQFLTQSPANRGVFVLGQTLR